MKILYFILAIIVLILGIMFASLNAESVVFNYYIGKKQMPLSLLLISFFILGAFLTLVITFFGTLKLKYDNRRLSKQVAQFKEQISKLRIDASKGNF